MDEGTALVLEAGGVVTQHGDGRMVRHAGRGSAEAGPRGRTLRVYHRTARGASIVRGGFAGGSANPSRDGAWEGTWFADVPLGSGDDAEGDEVLVLELPAGVVERYEWVDDAKPYRQFVLPRDVANSLGPPLILAPDGTLRDVDPRELDRGEDVWGGCPRPPGRT